MRLSLFRQRSNNTHNDGTGSITGATPPTSSKKSNRLSSMFSPSRSGRQDPATPPPPPPQQDSPPVTALQPRPATAGILYDPPFNPPPTAAEIQQSSSDGPVLPTSPQDHSFHNSSILEPVRHVSHVDGSNDAVDTPPSRRTTQLYMPLSRPKTASSSALSRDFSIQSQIHGPNTRASAASQFMPLRRESADAASTDRYRSPRSNNSRDSPSLSSSPAQSFQTPATRFRSPARSRYSYPEEDQVSYGGDSFRTSSLQHRLSSPSSAVAARRSRLRGATSALSNYGGLHDAPTSPSRAREFSASHVTSAPAESKRVSSAHLKSETTKEIRPAQNGWQDRSTSSSNPGLTSTKHQQHRPSQRSSAQSFQSKESEAMMESEGNVDTGATTPAVELPRLPSFDSVGSSASGGTEVAVAKGHKRTWSSTQQLGERGDPEMTSGPMRDNREASENATPRARRPLIQDPSETVVAQHVRNVEVPDTVAREYRNSHEQTRNGNALGLTSSPFAVKTKNAISLKDQNTKIDKLTKENFDLKLKIHFLYQALQDRSDEGVKDTISKNAQLQAELVQVKKENQTLRKRVRQLERSHSVEGPRSVALSNVDSEDGARSIMTAQLEEEVASLQRRMEDLQVENAQLSKDGQYQQLVARLDEEIIRRERAEQKLRNVQLTRARLEEASPRPHIRIQNSDRDLSRHGFPNSTVSKDSGVDVRDMESLSGGTLVSQLRQENDDLKRSLGAQASMLTSRNRERERLQREIEDLKLVHRRGELLGPGSAGGDSILDRSVSRAQNRSASGNSDSERGSQLSESERERYESMQAGLRDENALLRMRVQDLDRELGSLGEGAEHIRELQRERDNATRVLGEADAEIEQLNSVIRQLDDMVTAREENILQLQESLVRQEKESEEFRAEINAINESFELLVDDREGSESMIRSLQQDLSNANGELEAMETKLLDLTSTNERLEVQQESSQNEIKFLREEQEGDIIKISELQSALQAAQSTHGPDAGGVHERRGMQNAIAQARDDAREARKRLIQREAEVRLLQEKLDDATSTLEEAVSNFDGTKASYNEDIIKLQDELDDLKVRLQETEKQLAEKERMLSERDALLESSSHETRMLLDKLEKERQGRKHDRNEVERAMNKARGTPEAKALAMERSRELDKQQFAELKRILDSKVGLREEFLGSVWQKLFSICENEGLLDSKEFGDGEERSKSVDFAVLQGRFPRVLNAISTYISEFRSKLNDTEAALTTDFTALSHALSQRTTRLDELELMIANLSAPEAGIGKLRQKYDMAKNENRSLRREIKHLKQGSFSLPGLPAATRDMDRRFESATNGSSSLETQSHGSRSDAGQSSSMDTDAVSPIVHRGPRSKEKNRNKFSAGYKAPVPPGLSFNQDVNDDWSKPPVYSKSRNPYPSTEDAMKESRPLSAADFLGRATDFDRSDEQSATGQTQQQNGAALASNGVNVSGSDESDNMQNPQPDQSSSALATLAIKASDRTWAMRLDEMKKRMRLEREGRLLDRQNARTRLREAESEKQALKEELTRVKQRDSTRDFNHDVANGGTEHGDQNVTDAVDA